MGTLLGRRAVTAAVDGNSSFLAQVAATGEQLEAVHVARGAAHGDPFCVDLLLQAGRMIGAVLATFVNLYNPSLIVLGGGVAGAGDGLLASIRQSVYRRSLPLATRDLRIVRSRLGDKAGTIGAASLVVDELFSRNRLGLWLPYGSPNGRTDLTESDNAAYIEDRGGLVSAVELQCRQRRRRMGRRERGDWGLRPPDRARRRPHSFLRVHDSISL